MKAKIALFLLLSSMTAGAYAAPADGKPAGASAAGLAEGSTDAIGIGAVAALTGVFIATAGGSGSDASNTGTTTTTTTSTAK